MRIFFDKAQDAKPILLWALLLFNQGYTQEYPTLKTSSSTPAKKTDAKNTNQPNQPMGEEIKGARKAGELTQEQTGTPRQVSQWAIIAAAGKTTKDTLKHLLKLGSDINIRNRFGETALHEAVKHQRLLNVRFLLKRGANPSLKNKKGVSPRDLASKIAEQRPKNRIARKILRAFKTHTTTEN